MDGCDTAHLDGGDVFVLETPGVGGFGASEGGPSGDGDGL
jgi:N-methylhydantoinase B/oxoprolinase/acetone carboxylase alpha subunit